MDSERYSQSMTNHQVCDRKGCSKDQTIQTLTLKCADLEKQVESAEQELKKLKLEASQKSVGDCSNPLCKEKLKNLEQKYNEEIEYYKQSHYDEA